MSNILSQASLDCSRGKLSNKSTQYDSKDNGMKDYVLERGRKISNIQLEFDDLRKEFLQVSGRNRKLSASILSHTSKIENNTLESDKNKRQRPIWNFQEALTTFSIQNRKWTQSINNLQQRIRRLEQTIQKFKFIFLNKKTEVSIREHRLQTKLIKQLNDANEQNAALSKQLNIKNREIASLQIRIKVLQKSTGKGDGRYSLVVVGQRRTTQNLESPSMQTSYSQQQSQADKLELLQLIKRYDNLNQLKTQYQSKKFYPPSEQMTYPNAVDLFADIKDNIQSLFNLYNQLQQNNRIVVHNGLESYIPKISQQFCQKLEGQKKIYQIKRKIGVSLQKIASVKCLLELFELNIENDQKQEENLLISSQC